MFSLRELQLTHKDIFSLNPCDYLVAWRPVAPITVSHADRPVPLQARKPLKAVVVLSGDIAGTVYLTQQKPPLGPVDIDGFVQGQSWEPTRRIKLSDPALGVGRGWCTAYKSRGDDITVSEVRSPRGIRWSLRAFCAHS